MINRKNDGTFRISEFYQPTWVCLLCDDGFGLSSDFHQCLPCTDNCLTCYMAQNNSCITAKAAPPPVPTNNSNTTTGCQYYVDKATNKCVQSCSSSNSQPQFVNGVLYCAQTDSSSAQKYARIDSAIYVNSDGTKNVFFIIDQNVKT